MERQPKKTGPFLQELTTHMVDRFALLLISGVGGKKTTDSFEKGREWPVSEQSI